jgi:hypothetical protein
MSRVIWFALAVVCASSPAQDSPAAKELERLKVPARLIPDKSKVLFLLRAEGVQVYKGVLKDGKAQWELDGPDAILLEYDTGQKAGTHSKGPVWEAPDGSKVKGKPVDKVAAPNPTAVDWLLLETKSEGGDGRFSKVTHIARIDTWAGKPPAAAAPKEGARQEVRYQATYVFFGAGQ